uniref:Uncharacterized protein n=1 Tax=Melopsittacus undulatus TaxID=13146 RepID=A0A8C6N8J4_MELUD
ISLAGLGNFMQDVLWCFSQVKGTIDIGVAEGNSFPFLFHILFPFLFPSRITEALIPSLFS